MILVLSILTSTSSIGLTPTREETFHFLQMNQEDLGLEYLDLYLIHWPHAYQKGDVPFPTNESGQVIYDESLHPTECWLEMEKLVKKGLVKSIGVSNFNSVQIKDILENGSIKPVTNQVECHPYLNQSKLLEFCQDHNITITAYSPLGSPDRPWAPAGEEGLLDDPKIKEIADRYNKSSAQVLIKWQIQRGTSGRSKDQGNC